MHHDWFCRSNEIGYLMASLVSSPKIHHVSMQPALALLVCLWIRYRDDSFVSGLVFRPTSVPAYGSSLFPPCQYLMSIMWWQVVIAPFYFEGTGHVLFATMYAVTIFLLLKFWDKPVTKPRSAKYFIFTAVAIRSVAFISASPLISRDITFEKPADYCDCYPYSTGFVLLHSIIFSIAPAIVSLIFLIATVCYCRYKALNDEGSDNILKGLLKFGFFLIVVQAINVSALILLPIMYVNLLNKLFDDTHFSFRSVFDAIHLTIIPTPVLILIVFKLHLTYQLHQYWCLSW